MLKLFLIFFFIILINNFSYSHSGRTNSEGCHNKKSNNTYHCHNDKKKSNKESKSGSIKIIDGDTIHFGNKKYRFSGIDAPEKNQLCELDEKKIYCGIISKKILEKKISKNNVKCIEENKDRYGRIIAECFVNGESLSSFLVRAGYAFAYQKYSLKFVNDEEYAKKNKLGLWKMKFEYPWEYRKKH